MRARPHPQGSEVTPPPEQEVAREKIDGSTDLDNDKHNEGEDVRKRKADRDAPKKPSQGGYGVFLAEHRGRIGGSLPTGSNVASEANVQWRALPIEERRPYEQKYAEKVKAYQAALGDYTKA